MSVAERSAKYGVSRKLIRKMIKGGDIPREPKADLAATIQAKLSIGEQLSVAQLLALVKDRQLIRELGRYREEAREQVGLLGDVEAGAAPGHVVKNLRGAADGNAESAGIVMHWIKATLPQGPVRHHWIAARLLVSLWPNLHGPDFTCVWKALENVREHPNFREWWSKKSVGTQNPIFYQRPAQFYDL